MSNSAFDAAREPGQDVPGSSCVVRGWCRAQYHCALSLSPQCGATHTNFRSACPICSNTNAVSPNKSGAVCHTAPLRCPCFPAQQGSTGATMYTYNQNPGQDPQAAWAAYYQYYYSQYPNYAGYYGAQPYGGAPPSANPTEQTSAPDQNPSVENAAAAGQGASGGVSSCPQS